MSRRRAAGRVAALGRAAGLLAATGLAASLVAPASAHAEPNLPQLKQRAAALRAHLDALSVQQGLAVEQYDEAQDRLQQATMGQVTAGIAADDAQTRSQAVGNAAADRARAIYMSGGPAGLSGLLLQSTSISDALTRWQTLKQVVAADRVDVVRAGDTAAGQRVQEHDAALLRARRVADQAAADAAVTKVQRLLAEQRELVAQADADVVALAEQQRKAAEARALALAQQSAAAAGIAAATGVAGVTDAHGHGLEGATASTQQLPAVAAPNQTAAAAIRAAATRLGAPYVWGATGPGAFDCSGLTQWAYAQAGVAIPRTSRAQYAALPKVPLDQLQPGDLVFYAFRAGDPGSIHHVGMYLGNGLSIYAPQTGSNVKVGPVAYGTILGAVRPTGA